MPPVASTLMFHTADASAADTPYRFPSAPAPPKKREPLRMVTTETEEEAKGDHVNSAPVELNPLKPLPSFRYTFPDESTEGVVAGVDRVATVQVADPPDAGYAYSIEPDTT